MPLPRSLFIAELENPPQNDNVLRSNRFWRIGIDTNLVVHNGHWKSAQRNSAWRRNRLACWDMKRAIMKIAFHHIPVDKTFRKQSRPMGAIVIGNIKLAIHVKNRQRQI